MEKNVLKGMKNISRIVIVSLTIVLVVSMVLGTIDLFCNVFNRIASPDPYFLLISTEDLYSIFSILLIIIVGYELFKSMYILLHSDEIPVKSIIKVATIAMANKVITINLKEVSYQELFGIGLLIVALGLAYFLFSKDPKIND